MWTVVIKPTHRNMNICCRDRIELEQSLIIFIYGSNTAFGECEGIKIVLKQRITTCQLTLVYNNMYFLFLYVKNFTYYFLSGPQWHSLNKCQYGIWAIMHQKKISHSVSDFPSDSKLNNSWKDCQNVIFDIYDSLKSTSTGTLQSAFRLQAPVPFKAVL